MRASRSFTVRPELPPALSALTELACNLRWSWDDATRELFAAVDSEPETDATSIDPVAILNRVDRKRLATLADDPRFLERVATVRARLSDDLEAPRWFQSAPRALHSVAYFSPEFGIAEALPQYSGGLGVLAGDHLKASSALGVPIVGVGLLYRQGYFRQELNDDGWQQERYIDLDPHAMALTLMEGCRVQLDLAGTPLTAAVWRASVGRVSLYLLDSDLEENGTDERRVTDRLYGGSIEHRLRQEILLGIGGVRALRALGETPQVFHTNEGHAGFLALERIRQAIVENGLRFEEAVEAVRAGTVFTTHTPVPAGIDLFPRALMLRYFQSWADECGVGIDTLMALGQEPGDSSDAPFNMAVMGLHLATWSNAVSQLHGIVSRRMFAGLWPGLPPEEVPITSITNGVHSESWVAEPMARLFEQHVAPDWSECEPERWAGVDQIDDAQLWALRNQGRAHLVRIVRERLRNGARSRGVSEADMSWFDDVLDPDTLTIGFARRFAGYKRATLLLSQPERLEELLTSTDRPVQLIFAGKAHPADEQGKHMIRQLVQYSRQARVRHRLVFVEDYDIAVARLLLHGCDVWLNTPRRPFEACGTSGMKAVLNGALNCSIRDGWWDEMFDGENGWAIASAESYGDLDWRDRMEGSNLFDLLERRVVPLFYQRDEGIPRAWLKRVKASLRSLGPQITATRMTRSYVQDLYEPAAAYSDGLRDGDHRRARALAAWKRQVRESWPKVDVNILGSVEPVAPLGASGQAAAVVALGGLQPDDVEVQLLHGPVGLNGELRHAEVAVMGMVSPYGGDSGRYRYEGSFSCDRAGHYGFAVRVVPSHPDLFNFAELGCAAWA